MKKIAVSSLLGLNVTLALLGMASDNVICACIGLALLASAMLIGRYYVAKGYYDDVEE